MKKGSSYRTLTDGDTKHFLVKALHNRGFSGVQLVYASHWSSDAGWTLLSCKSDRGTEFSQWLGFTKWEAENSIALLNPDYHYYVEEYKNKLKIKLIGEGVINAETKPIWGILYNEAGDCIDAERPISLLHDFTIGNPINYNDTETGQPINEEL